METLRNNIEKTENKQNMISLISNLKHESTWKIMIVLSLKGRRTRNAPKNCYICVNQRFHTSISVALFYDIPMVGMQFYGIYVSCLVGSHAMVWA